MLHLDYAQLHYIKKHVLDITQSKSGSVIFDSLDNLAWNFLISIVESTMDLTTIIAVWVVYFKKINILYPIFNIPWKSPPENQDYA